MPECNQAREIYEAIRKAPTALSAREIAESTGWNRHVVDVAIPLLIEAGMVFEIGKTKWDEPTYLVKDVNRIWAESANVRMGEMSGDYLHPTDIDRVVSPRGDGAREAVNRGLDELDMDDGEELY